MDKRAPKIGKYERVYYYVDCSEYCESPKEIYSEFCNGVATRQINITDSEMKVSSKHDILYDGDICDLDMSESLEISKDVFEEKWIAAGGAQELLFGKGNAAKPHSNRVVICHIVNNKAKWGKGFVTSLNEYYPMVKEEYVKFCSMCDDKNLLGKVFFYKVRGDLYIANVFSQDGYKKNKMDKKMYVKYNILEECLEKVAYFSMINRFTVQMPRIGAGLGGGEWNIIEKIIKEKICYYGVACKVLDF